MNELFSLEEHPNSIEKSYIYKAIEYLSCGHTFSPITQNIVRLFEEPVDVNLHAQIVQLFEYLPNVQRTFVVMSSIFCLFKKASYVHRSHVIRLITCIPDEQRTLEVVQEMTIFFQQVATDWRYDIFNALEKIEKEQRYAIIDIVSKIIRSSENWLFLSKRTPALIDAIHQIAPCKRQEVLFCFEHYPIVALQENIYSAICVFCPGIEES